MSGLLTGLLNTLKKQQKQETKPAKATKPAKPKKVKPKTSPAEEREARDTAREIINFAREEAEKIRTSAKDEIREIKLSLRGLQDKLAREEAALESNKRALRERREQISAKEKQIESKREELEKIKKQQIEKLEKIASLSKDEAKKILLDSLEKHLSRDIAERIRDAEEEIKSVADEKAREILVDSMYHGATDYVAEYTISTVKIPDEEIKGRIIGKEGRNIRAFERATGVDLDLDETPGEIRLSSFDPVRREIARVSLMRLIKDGRIQPSRIEEYVAKAKKELDKIIYEEGKKLCHAVGVYNLPHELMSMLGKFRYRFSYGQNLLSHTLEETKIGMALANELGADVETVKLGCLLHDIGKVIPDEEGSHVELGVKLLKKFNIPKPVIDTVAQHHEDEEYTSIESILVYIADAISGSRPGARYEDYDEYIKRLTTLEEMAMSKKGVKEAFAIQAGREVRVIVDPEVVSDDDIQVLAHKLRDEIQTNMTYPGTVTVNVIREKRAVDVAK